MKCVKMAPTAILISYQILGTLSAPHLHTTEYLPKGTHGSSDKGVKMTFTHERIGGNSLFLNLRWIS